MFHKRKADVVALLGQYGVETVETYHNTHNAMRLQVDENLYDPCTIQKGDFSARLMTPVQSFYGRWDNKHLI